MEMEEIVKIGIVLVVLVVLLAGVVFLLKDKGFSLLDSIKNFMRFGGK